MFRSSPPLLELTLDSRPQAPGSRDPPGPRPCSSSPHPHPHHAVILPQQHRLTRSNVSLRRGCVGRRVGASEWDMFPLDTLSSSPPPPTSPATKCYCCHPLEGDASGPVAAGTSSCSPIRWRSIGKAEGRKPGLVSAGWLHQTTKLLIADKQPRLPGKVPRPRLRQPGLSDLLGAFFSFQDLLDAPTELFNSSSVKLVVCFPAFLLFQEQRWRSWRTLTPTPDG